MLSQVPLEPLWAAIQRPPAWVWLATLIGLLLSYALRAARLQVVLGLESRPGAPASTRVLGLRLDALRVILQHNAAVNLLPMRAGELSFPWLASRELGLPLPRAVVCLMWMRLQDLAVLLALGLILWPGLPPLWRGLGLLALFAGWHGGWRLLRAILESRVGAGQTPSLTSPSPASPAAWRRILFKLEEALREPAHHRPAAWGLTFANWALKLAAGATLLAAISAMPWAHAWSAALGGELAAIFPLQGPAGFGTYEAGVWAGAASVLPRSAPALNDVIGAALALHVCFLTCAVLAAAMAILLRPPRSAGHPG